MTTLKFEAMAEVYRLLEDGEEVPIDGLAFFKRGLCYQNGQFLGDVIAVTKEIIKVRQRNGGLADGAIRTFIRYSKKGQ